MSGRSIFQEKLQIIKEQVYELREVTEQTLDYSSVPQFYFPHNYVTKVYLYPCPPSTQRDSTYRSKFLRTRRVSDGTVVSPPTTHYVTCTIPKTSVYLDSGLGPRQTTGRHTGTCLMSWRDFLNPELKKSSYPLVRMRQDS